MHHTACLYAAWGRQQHENSQTYYNSLMVGYYGVPWLKTKCCVGCVSELMCVYEECNECERGLVVDCHWTCQCCVASYVEALRCRRSLPLASSLGSNPLWAHGINSCAVNCPLSVIYYGSYKRCSENRGIRHQESRALSKPPRPDCCEILN